MVTISGPLMLGSGSTSTCLARGEQGWSLWKVWAPGVPLSHFKSFRSDRKPTPPVGLSQISVYREHSFLETEVKSRVASRADKKKIGILIPFRCVANHMTLSEISLIVTQCYSSELSW